MRKEKTFISMTALTRFEMGTWWKNTLLPPMQKQRGQPLPQQEVVPQASVHRGHIWISMSNISVKVIFPPPPWQSPHSVTGRTVGPTLCLRKALEGRKNWLVRLAVSQLQREGSCFQIFLPYVWKWKGTNWLIRTDVLLLAQPGDLHVFLVLTILDIF